MSAPDEGLRATVDAAAAAFGATAAGAVVLHEHSNTIVALPAAKLVLRIAGSPDAFERVAGSVRVCGWLARGGYPCTVPADDEARLIGGRAVSAWHLEDTTDAPVTMTGFGTLLRDLHRAPEPPFPVRLLADPFASVTTALETARGISAGDLGWLRSGIKELSTEWAGITAAAPRGLIHGDAHPGNVMSLTDGRLILGDWDHTAMGPREWDLIQAVYTRRRFGRPAADALGELAAAYGRDIRDWPHTGTLVRIREITGLSPYIRAAGSDAGKRAELAHRLATLRAGDATASWHTA